jgi:EAL domain-containing protein (putative c-di-GMP-specific phosphodiesterase class I)
MFHHVTSSRRTSPIACCACSTKPAPTRTGFSALSYLHRFPIECLKIDQSFIAGLGSETRMESEAVVRAIQALAGSLGIHTVAEGIENVHQQRLVRELGCTLGQGYLYGRPLPELVESVETMEIVAG